MIIIVIDRERYKTKGGLIQMEGKELDWELIKSARGFKSKCNQKDKKQIIIKED